MKKRSLIIRFSSLGDIIQTFPSADYLLSGDREVHYLTKNAFRPLLETYGLSATIHTIPDHASFGELIQKARELRALSFDEVYDLHRNIRSRLVTFLLGGMYRRIKKYRFKEFILFIFRRKIYSIIWNAPLNRPAEAMRIVGGDAIVPGKRLKSLPPLPGSVLKIADKFKSGYVCIAPESIWREKEWPIARFVDVAKSVQALGFGIIWVGVRPLPSEAKLSGSVDLTGKTSLSEVASVLGEARLLLTNDSGLMHLAEAAGTRVVAIFGPTSLELGFGPRLKESRVVEAELWCRPCSKTGRWCFRPINRRKCLSEVSVAQVSAAIGTALGEL